MTHRVRQLTGARDLLVAQVRAEGLDVIGPGTDFVRLPFRSEAATVFGQWCAHAGIGVRVLPGEGVRIAVGDESADAAVIAAVRQWSSSCAQTRSPRAATRVTSVRRNP
jgi:histidinol-phosphate aminotransferase